MGGGTSVRVHDDRPARWPVRISLAVLAVVLASHLFFVSGLVAEGVTWRDGPHAYGVQGAELPEYLPRWAEQSVFLVLVLAVLLGPFLVLASVGVAALAARARWRGGRRLDVLATTTAALGLTFLVTVVTWGDEVWVWLLD